MSKKIFLALLTILVLCACGCGVDEKKNTSVVTTPEFSADKAILAYAQLYAYGAPDDPKVAGLPEKFVADAQQTIFKRFDDYYPLDEKTLREVVKNFSATLKTRMEIKTSIKNSDAAHPVVELSAKIIDWQRALKNVDVDKNLILLRVTWGELQAQGFSDEQLRKDSQFQKLALESLSRYFGNLPLKTDAKIDVTCKISVGEDGKFYWSPEKPDELAKFIMGQK